MVYYLTSTNVKLINNIKEDYSRCDSNFTPYEYMKKYIENCPEEVDDDKLTWIAETFLGIQKHNKFLQNLCSRVVAELSNNEIDYLITILYSIIFQLQPQDKECVYKCIFNLSKELLQHFTVFFSNNEILAYVSQVACTFYDAKYVTEKIIAPLFIWQPYISEMNHDYETYAQRSQNRRKKSPTIPSEMRVLNRQRKPSITSVPRVPTAINVTYKTSKISHKKSKMLTKHAIDQRLKLKSSQNKQRAAQLLNEVKNQDYNFAKNKSNKYYDTIASIQEEMQNSLRPQQYNRKPINTKTPPMVKETITSIKRMSKTMAKTEQEEIKFVNDILKNCRNTAKIEEFEENKRNEKSKEVQVNMEKNRLKGQISHEEAIIAKQKITDENKNKYQDFMKEKEIWLEKIDEWKKEEFEKNKKNVEKLSLLELQLLEAKSSMSIKKKDDARTVKEQTDYLLSKALKEKYDELQKKVNMIKEMKVLALVANKAKIPKIIDLTESSGFGLLCEMSIAELQERLTGLKMELKEQLEMKKRSIKSDKDNAKKELEETKHMIQQFVTEKASMKKKKVSNGPQNSGSGDIAHENVPKDIAQLKNTLLEKRQQRMKIIASRVR